MKINILIFLIGIVLFGSCKNSRKDQNRIFVGGQIMNPYNNKFILSKNGKAFDTLYLDMNNQFGKEFKDLEPGIYSFSHPPENQIMYLEPGDSILVWLNTLQFDESLNYSGPGSAKSSFLLDMFLKNEKNNKMMLSYYKISPSEFAGITDSIKNSRKKKLQSLDQEKKFSTSFLDLANKSIEYDFYHLRERYTFLVKKYYSEMANEIPEDFHNYRKNLNFNDPRLKEYYGYLNFIEDFLRTKSIERCMEKENTNSECFQLHAIDNIQYRMNLADSLINNREIKNIFINRLAIQGMIFSNEAQKINSVLELLKTIDFQSKNLSELEELARIQKNLLPGNNIGDLELINFKDEVVRLKEISTKPIITYHWSMEAPEHYRWQHELIKTLGNKYPEIEFVGINIDKNATEAWKNTLNAQGFASNNEYKLYNPSINMRLLKNHLNKLIFLDTNGQIINGAAQLNTPGFERQILEFLNN